MCPPTAMLVRDAVLLLTCAIAVLLSLQGKGELKARVEWFESIDPSTYANEHFPESHERLPSPIITDLDGDGTEELYVASDEQGEVRRYAWREGSFEKSVIHRREVAGSVFTWNLMPVPMSLGK